jgi:DNA-directed RNA polymerase specialized sigma24 family protein/ribosome-associated translation inhibitor RaiA
MTVRYNTINYDMRPTERELVETDLERVAEHLKNFPRPSWHVELERSPRKGGYGLSVHVKLSTRSLFATAWSSELRGASEAVSTKLVRQAKRHLEQLRRNERAGAESARRPVAARGPTAEELETARDLEDFSDRIGHHVAQLHRVLRRELSLDERAEKVGGAISIPDLVEDAVAYVFEHFREKPKELTPDRWLVRRGLIFLDAELDRAGRDAEPLPEGKSEPQEDWEELMNLPVLENLPFDGRAADADRAEPDVVQQKLRACHATAQALKGLSPQHRTSIVLRHIEGYEIPEIAFVLNSEDERVRDWLEEAEVELQDQLRHWRPS